MTHGALKLPLSITIGLLACTFAASCVPELDDDLSLVTAPRILAVRSVPAEAKPGQEVELSVLAVDPSGSSVGDEVKWAFCLARKPLTELGPVAQTCIDRFGSNAKILSPIGQGPTVRAKLPAEACQLFGPLRPPGESGAAGRAVDPDLTGGYHQPVVLGDTSVALGAVRLTCGITGVPSSESIRYNQGQRPNENPELAQLELIRNGEAQIVGPGTTTPGATVRAGERVELRASWSECPREPVCGDGLCTAGENQVSCAEDCRQNPRGCSGAETYLWANPETRTVQTRREGLTVAWFSNAGTFAEEQTGRTEDDPDGIDTRNDWQAPTSPGTATLWVVLRDDRGGTSWSQFLIAVEP